MRARTEIAALVAGLLAAGGCGLARPPGGVAGPVPARPPVAGPSAPYRDPASLRPGEILHGATGRLLGRKELLEYLVRFPVVYVGEVHDSPQDHLVQLAVLEGLHARVGARLALGVEMLPRTEQAAADAYVRGELDEAAFERLWVASGSAWEPYAPLLRFARAKGLRVVALNVEAELREAVAQRGLEHLPPALAARLPEMDLSDPLHRAYVASVFAGHGPGATDLERFYRVQVLWDETMAASAARFLREAAGGDPRLLVLAGRGHVAYGFGIPRRLFRRVPLPYATLLPVHVEGSGRGGARRLAVTPAAPPVPAADLYWGVHDES